MRGRTAPKECLGDPIRSTPRRVLDRRANTITTDPLKGVAERNLCDTPDRGGRGREVAERT